MAELQELMEAFGAQQGVRFAAPRESEQEADFGTKPRLSALVKS
jgi:hypothetical protein